MKKSLLILFVLNILVLSVIPVLGAANLVARMPDFYAYELRDTELLTQHDIGLSEDDLSKFLANFLNGQGQSFSLVAEWQGESKELFSIYEDILMNHVRSYLGQSLYVLGGSIFFATLVTILFKKQGKNQAIRLSYQFSYIPFGLIWLVASVSLSINGADQRIASYFSGNHMEQDSLLAEIATPGFFSHAMVVVLGISLILSVLIGYVLFTITKPKRIFW